MDIFRRAWRFATVRSCIIGRPEMAMVVFYEKPRCINNTRQKAWLMASGHRVEARNLLTHPWQEEELRAFFGTSPVEEWFNAAAPRIRDGQIRTDTLEAHEAIALMLADPLLIRRPLMEVDGTRRAGFDVHRVRVWIGLVQGVDLDETCSRYDSENRANTEMRGERHRGCGDRDA